MVWQDYNGRYIAKSMILMDRPDKIEQYQQMEEIEPGMLLDGDTPHMIDEWQIAPK